MMERPVMEGVMERMMERAVDKLLSRLAGLVTAGDGGRGSRSGGRWNTSRRGDRPTGGEHRGNGGV